MGSRQQSAGSASGSPGGNNSMNDDETHCPTCFTPYTREHDPYGTGDSYVVYWANCFCQDDPDECEEDTNQEEMP